MWLVAIVIGVVALLLYGAHHLGGKLPRRHRRHGPGEIKQAVDHRFGRFGGWYPQDIIRREGVPKIGRNDPCPCGSGRKYKRCCGR